MKLKTIFDYQSHNTEYIRKPESSAHEKIIPESVRSKKNTGLPCMGESDVMRHYTNLSRKNFGVDTGFYPLGSCTMKHNPRINEELAGLPAFAGLHPALPETEIQGLLGLIHDLENFLTGLSGMDRVSFQPAAGAHGELTGLFIISAWLKKTNKTHKKTVLVPDSSHGTNPATASIAGFSVRQIPSTSEGLVDLKALKEACTEETAALMLTNPNTLGLFEKEIKTIASIIHAQDALLYYDGANLNALMGQARPGDMDFDLMQFNLHKTFSTPHGGGGPGSGPVAVKKFLTPFLPAPLVDKQGDRFILKTPESSIGKVRSWLGNTGVILKACIYCLILGEDGLKRASETAVLNANYLMEELKDVYDLAVPGPCMHEFVLSGERFKKTGIHTLDIAKRLIDLGYHPPTVYFPLIVKEAMMIEPTETENLSTLDSFIGDMKKIVSEINENPKVLKEAPLNTSVKRVDEARAARDLLRS